MLIQISLVTIILTIWVVITKLHLIHQTLEIQNKHLAKLSGLELDSEGNEIVEEESEPSEEPTS